MRSFFPLIQNENMKIYRRPRTWIMLGIVIAILSLMVIIQKTDRPQIAETQKNYKEVLQQRIDGAQKELNNPDFRPSDEFRKMMESELLVNQYALDHEINTIKRTLWNTALSSADLIALMAIFTIVIAADSVAGEFSGGTIKLLLIRPVRRWKILLSKYASVLMYAVVGLVILFASALIIGGIGYGFDGFNIPYLYVDNGIVHERSMFVQVLITYGYDCVSLLMMVTFAFMISSAFRSSSMAIGISLGLMFLGDLIVHLLRKYEWIKYFLFSNIDLRQYLNGTPIVDGMTLGFSITMLLLYFAAFNIVAWLLFTKRDVAA